jgi:hypothetical protein
MIGRNEVVTGRYYSKIKILKVSHKNTKVSHKKADKILEKDSDKKTQRKTLIKTATVTPQKRRLIYVSF